MSVQLVNYYHLKEGRNAGVVVAFGSWPERVLKHRGWTRERRIHLRVATEREHEMIRESMRYQAWLYRTRSELLEDETENLEQVFVPDALSPSGSRGGLQLIPPRRDQREAIGVPP